MCFFFHHVAVEKLAISERVFEQIDALEHFNALFRGERAHNIHAACSFQENVYYHPVRFMLSFFIRGVICSQSQELEDIAGVHIFAQFLNQTLL